MKPIELNALVDLLMINHCYYEHSSNTITTLATPNYTTYSSEDIKNKLLFPLIKSLSTINELRQVLRHYKKSSSFKISNKSNQQKSAEYIEQIKDSMYFKTIISLNVLYKNIYRMLSDNIFSQHRYHPNIEFLINNLSAIISHIPKNKLPEQDERNTFLDYFCDLLEKQSIDKKIYSFQFKAQKNYQQLSSYTKQLLALYPPLTIIHMDLYIKTNNNWCFPDEPIVAADYKEFKCYKTILLHTITTSYLKDELVGYAWKIDHNKIKGFFCHLLLFFNKKTPIIQLTEWLNTLWHDNASKKKGGVITTIVQTNQKNITSTLQCIIDIMTHLDNYLYFRAPKNEKTFGRGRLSTQKISKVKQTIANASLSSITGSPLMANPPHKSKPARSLISLKQSLANLFINQCSCSAYGRLKLFNELTAQEQQTESSKLIKNTVETLVELTALIRILIKDNTIHYQWQENPVDGHSIQATEQGKHLYFFLCQDLNPIQSLLSGLSTNPLLTLFFKTLALWQCGNSINRQTPKDLDCFQALVDFISLLRRHATHDNAKYIDKAHQKAIEKNHRLLLQYIKVLEKKYSALFVCQVEFSYTSALRPTESSDLGMFFTLQNNASYDLVKQHRQMLFKQLNKTYGARLAGFAWKLKYSSVKGFYHEWLLLFDKSNPSTNSEIIKLHSLWLSITQKGSVHFQSCWLNKTKEYKAAHPKKERAEQRALFNTMLCSLTQLDQYVYFDPKTLNSHTKDRTFNRGHL